MRLAIISVLLGVAAVLALPLSAVAVDGDASRDKINIAIEKEYAMLPAATINGGHCYPYTFNLSPPANKANKRDYIISPCSVETSFGRSDGDYIKEAGVKLAGKLSGFFERLPVPGTDKFIAITRAGYNAQHLTVVKNFYPPINRVVNPSDHKLYYDIASGYDYLPVRDQEGNKLPFLANTVRTSTGGAWAAAYIPGIGAARISLDDGEVRLFGDWRGYNGMAISDDGRWAAEYNASDKSIKVYDINACPPTPAYINSRLNCGGVLIKDELNDKLGKVNWISALKWLDSKHLLADIDFTDTAGNRRYARVQLALAGSDTLNLAIDYVAMGDSFASGEGDDSQWYMDGTDIPVNNCHVSLRSYPYLLGRGLGMDEYYSVACSGARIEHVLSNIQKSKSINSKWRPGGRVQINQLTPKNINIITISIGGNNVGFAAKLRECVLGPGACKYAKAGAYRAQTAWEIARLYRRLVETYDALKQRTDYQTKIYAVGYPQFVEARGGNCGLNVRLNADERYFIGQAVGYINRVIAAAARAAGIGYLDIESALAGKKLCSAAKSWELAVNGLSAGNDVGLPGLRFIGNESYHPNAIGHRLIYQNIMKLTKGNIRLYSYCQPAAVICEAEAPIPIPDASYWGSEALEYVNSLNSKQSLNVVVPEYRSSLVVQNTADNNIKIQVKGLKPNSSIRVEIQSTPRPLGEYTVDSLGEATLSLNLNGVAEPGPHTVHIYGINLLEEAVEYYQEVFVYGPQGDVDGDGVPDSQDPCFFVAPAGVDEDRDGIDDACDAFVTQPKRAAPTSNFAASSTPPLADDVSSNVHVGSPYNPNKDQDKPDAATVNATAGAQSRAVLAENVVNTASAGITRQNISTPPPPNRDGGSRTFPQLILFGVFAATAAMVLIHKKNSRTG